MVYPNMPPFIESSSGTRPAENPALIEYYYVDINIVDICRKSPVGIII